MSADPSVMASYSSAASATKMSLRGAVLKHPVAYGVAAAVLLVSTIVLAVMLHNCQKNKSGFGVARINNLNTGSNNPLWWHGSGDAGWGGPVHREATPYHVAHYTPGWRATECRCCSDPCTCGGASASKSGGHMAVHQGMEGMQAAPNGSHMTAAAPGCGVGPMWGCSDTWDPAASAEAQALATIGSLKHSPHATRRLQGSVDAAFDCSGMSDCELSQVMHQGGAP
jgi:hypothetical protein